VNGVSVALDETTREVNERQVRPSWARARESSRAADNGPIATLLLFQVRNRPNCGVLSGSFVIRVSAGAHRDRDPGVAGGAPERERHVLAAVV
jgi:hypothetical protein